MYGCEIVWPKPIGNAVSYQYGDPGANTPRTGVLFNGAGLRFAAGTDGLGMSPMASHGLSLVPLGQSNAAGEHKWLAMGRTQTGTTIDSVA